MRPQIRRARPSDARAIARVHAASWQVAYRGILPEPYLDSLQVPALSAGWRRRLRDPAGSGRTWLASVEGTPVAVCIAQPGQQGDFAGWGAEVSFLYVHPALWGRGIGSALFAHVVGQLETLAFRWLTVAVLERNERARSFYEQHGLRRDGARWPDERFGSSLVRYAKPLNPVVDFASLRTAGVR